MRAAGAGAVPLSTQALGTGHLTPTLSSWGLQWGGLGTSPIAQGQVGGSWLCLFCRDNKASDVFGVRHCAFIST